MNTNYKVLFPHDDLSFIFIKYLEKKLKSSGFEKSFEHLDPGGVDVYSFQTKAGHTVAIKRCPVESDRDELNISSEWEKLSQIIENSADEFSAEIASMIKKGRI